MKININMFTSLDQITPECKINHPHNIGIIKSSSGPCHEDPGDPVSIDESPSFTAPSPANPYKARLKSDSEKGYFFFELFYLLLAWLLRKRINQKRNSLFPNRI